MNMTYKIHISWKVIKAYPCVSFIYIISPGGGHNHPVLSVVLLDEEPESAYSPWGHKELGHD